MPPRILIADSRKDESLIQNLLASEFEVIAVTTIKQATKALKEEQFDLIMVDVSFDESRMFDVLQLSKAHPLSAETPVICFAVEVTPIGRVVHESLCFTVRALGAWMFLSLHDLAHVEMRRAELLRVIQRCLTGEERKKTQAARVDVHKRRLDIHQLRVDVETEDWSQQLEDRLLQIRADLTTLLHELCDLQIGSISQQESIDESRRMKDYVDVSVVEAEDEATRIERKESLEELNSSVDEFKIAQREEAKKKRRKRAS
jgi:response regulator RpfG family c-di-GMP phosphodiesterase